MPQCIVPRRNGIIPYEAWNAKPFEFLARLE